MKFAVEPWSPQFGVSIQDADDGDPSSQKIDLDLEVASGEWKGIPGRAEERAQRVSFLDGVRRIDANVWIMGQNGPRRAICASCAAGIVRCDRKAEVIAYQTRRYLIGPDLAEPISTVYGPYETVAVADENSATLMNGLARALNSLEAELASEALGEDLIVVDGPLRGRERVKRVVGYIKSHHMSYLGDSVAHQAVSNLQPFERSPVFLVESSWTRYSWYMRLPGALGHPWAGIVRCEAPSSLSKYQAIEIADLVTATVPPYASEPHKETRAPANLYPIRGLEDSLRHRLGNSEVLHRAIRNASANP